MRTIREELIEVRNKIDEFIKQLEPETEVTFTPEEPLENIIFNTRLFNTQEKLGQLKQIIGSFIGENPIKDEIKVDAKRMSQFFCLYAALWSRMCWPMRVWPILSDKWRFGFLGGSVLPPLQASIIDMGTIGSMPAVNVLFVLTLICFVMITIYGYRSYLRSK